MRTPGLGEAGFFFAALSTACGASRSGGEGGTGGADAMTDGAFDDVAAVSADATPGADAGDGAIEDTTTAGGDAAEGGAGPYVTGVVSFTPGPCAGFGASSMPGIVEGPPHGGGASQGSLDVVSLGVGGEIVVSFAPNAIADGPGPDFIVFENPFDISGNPQDPFAEPGEVSVSDDGVTWTTYPCTATAYPYGECAGWHPVYSSPGNGISAVNPAVAGGDDFDLADVGLTRARFVRIRDVSGETCPDAGGPTNAGFDLDAVSIVNLAP